LAQFLVERFLPGEPEAQLALIASRAGASAEMMLSEGVPVRYLGSTLIPQDQICFCLFEGPSVEAVEEVNRRAGLTFERVLEAFSIGPAEKDSHPH